MFDMAFQKISRKDCIILAVIIVLLGLICLGVFIGVHYSLFRSLEFVLPKIEEISTTATKTTSVTVTTSEEGKFDKKNTFFGGDGIFSSYLFGFFFQLLLHTQKKS